MSAYELANHGWDIVTAITQRKLNSELTRVPKVPVKKQLHFNGVDATVDVVIGAPQLSIEKVGQLVDVRLGLTGTVTLAGEPTTFPPSSYVTVTTNLTYVEAELQPPAAGKTSYELIIDLESKDALYKLSVDGLPQVIVGIIENVIKNDIGNGKQYKVADFSLSDSDLGEAKALVPKLADFLFVRDEQNVDRSNLLVLMSTTKKKGSLDIKKPLLPPGQDFAVLVSNHILIGTLVLDPLEEKIKEKAVEADKVPGKIVVKQIDAEKDLWQIENNADIALKDIPQHPWISKVTAFIDPGQELLQVYFNVHANVEGIASVTVWNRAWLQFVATADGKIDIKQAKDDHDASVDVPWYERIILGVILNIVLEIVKHVIEGKLNDFAASLGQEFNHILPKPIGVDQAKVKQVQTPGHLILYFDII